jgi:hypothetical protein
MTSWVKGGGSVVKARDSLVVAAIVLLFSSASLYSLGTEGDRAYSQDLASPAATSAITAPLVVTTDKPSYLPGEPVNITATFPYGYSGIFPTSLTMYFVITDIDDFTIYDMSKHGYWLMVITGLTVGPGYSRSFTWNQIDDSGKPVIAPKWLNAVVIVPAWSNPLRASTEFEINPMPASFKDSLSPGWNFVSMPLLNDSLSAGRLGLGTGSIIVGWNTVTQSYSSAFIVGTSPEFMDYDIVAGNAYFIWSPQDQPLLVRGCSPDYFTKFSTYLNVPSGGGWAGIGFSSLGSGFYASEVPGLVKGASVSVVCVWDSASGQYHVYVPGKSPPFQDFVIGPGDGCWLLLNGPGTLSYLPR